jgi:RNA polymerase sigma-70 factor (ECF subfamily)
MAIKDIHSDLIEGCRKSNRKSQIRVYELYYKAMYNTSFRIVNNSFEAEDIMQESFIDAFEKIDTFKETGTFGSWLKRIVINKSLDHIKKNKPEIFSIDEKDYDVKDYREADDSYADHVFYQMKMIYEALDQLPDNYRIILSLHLLEGYDQQEIAQILNISYNNVRTRYSRAKQSLIQMIAQSKKEYLNTLTN